MSVRPHPRNPNKWYVDYYPTGRHGQRVVRVITGTQAQAHVVEAELRRASSPNVIEVSPKVIDIVPEWLDWYRVNRLPSTYKDVENTLKLLKEHFGAYQFSRLTPAVIEQYKSKRLATKVCRRTITKELTYFSSLIKFAVKNRYAEPLSFKIEKFDRKLIKAPEPVLPTPQEIEAIIASIEPEYKPLLLLLYDAGLRRSEAMNIKAEDIYLDRGFFRVLGKGNKERFVPVTSRRLLDAFVGAIQRVPTGYLFLNPATGRPWHDIRKAILRAAVKAGINEKDKPARLRVYHHLFRHSFGTYGLSAGIGMRALQGIMGHSDIKTTERYTHLLGDYLKNEGVKFGAYLEKKSLPGGHDG